MTKLSVLPLAAVLSAAPAASQPERKTELVSLDGTSVDRIRLRHDIDGVWVIDSQNILYRDTSHDHYLVTLEAACRQIERRRSFNFEPASPWQLRADRSYEIRPQVGRRCDVARIEQIDPARALALRDASLRREW